MTFYPFKAFGDTTGAIIKWGTMMCSVPPLVYAEASVAAALRLFVAYTEPNWKYLYKLGTGKSVLCSFKATAEAVEEFEPSWQQASRRFLFSMDELLDRNVYWMWLGDVLSDGIVKWTSNVMKVARCNAPQSPNLAYGPPMIFGSPGTTDWQSCAHGFNRNPAGQPLVDFGWTPKIEIADAMMQSGSVTAAGMALPTASRWWNSATEEVQDDTTKLLDQFEEGDTTMTFMNWGSAPGYPGTWYHQVSCPIGDRFNRLSGQNDTFQYSFIRELPHG